MRLLYLITRGDSIGGAQIHVRDLARRLTSDGHDITVAMGTAGLLQDELEAAGVTTEILPELQRETRFRSDLAALRSIRRLLRDRAPDLISAHSSKAGFLGRVAGRLEGVPCIFTAHGWAFTDGVPRHRRLLYFLLEAAVAPLGPAIVCVSRHDEDLVRRVPWMRRRSITVHNGVLDIPRSLRAGADSDPPRAVMVGRLDLQKDHPLLFQALARVPGLSIELIGDGPRRAELELLATELGVADRMQFVGQRLDVAERLATSQLFVLASRWEGLPRSIIEAMRAGLPVVASHVGGVAELVDDGLTGALVPSGDLAALAQAIDRYVSDATLRSSHGAAARDRYEARFTFDRLVAETEGVYRRVLDQVSRPA